MTDPLERFLDDLRFELPDGLVDRAKRSAGAERAPAANIRSEPGRWTWRSPSEVQRSRGMVLIAALLATAIVLTLVFTAHSIRQPGLAPAGSANPSSPVNTHRPVAGSALWPVDAASYFTATDAAMFVESPPDPNMVQLEITHDGGASWLSVGEPVSWWLPIKVTWFDRNHLLAFVNGGIEVTADGGVTWRWTLPPVSIAGPGYPNLEFTAISFIDANIGWGICPSSSPCADSHPSGLFRTLDSGVHWSRIGSLDLAPGIEPLGIHFGGAGQGFLTTTGGQVQPPGLFVTLDGGKTWQLSQLSPATTFVAMPAMFGQSGVILSEPLVGDWKTYATTDGGMSWANPRVFPTRVAQSKADPWTGVLDLSHWWTVDDQGWIYRTADAGLTWQRSLPKMPVVGGIRLTLSSATPVTGQVLWGTAVRTGTSTGWPVRSVDGGATWQSVLLPPAAP